MAKENGIGMTVTVDDSDGTARAITNDVTNLDFGIPSGVQDVTGINSTGYERLLLLADFTVSLNGVFNDAVTTQSHVVLKNYRTLASGDTGRFTAIAHSGQTIDDFILYSDYSLSRGADGSLTWSAPGNMSGGAAAAAPAWS